MLRSLIAKTGLLIALVSTGGIAAAAGDPPKPLRPTVVAFSDQRGPEIHGLGHLLERPDIRRAFQEESRNRDCHGGHPASPE